MAKNQNTFKLISTLSILLLLLSTIQTCKVLAFGSETHEENTEAALKKFGFSLRAIEEVTNANLAQDSIICYGPCPGTSNSEIPEYHGDRLPGENSLQAFNRLRNFINKTRSWIKENLTNCNDYKARVALGQALHALQDFYSHSNLVDRGVFTDEEKADIKKALDDPSYNPRALEKLKITGWGMSKKDDPEKYHHDEKNKDTLKCPLGKDAFKAAKSAAKEHTEAFLNELKKELKEEEWNKLIGKSKPPAKPHSSVKEREIERLLEDYRGIEVPWPLPLPEIPPGPPWKWDCFEISIRYSSNWTTSLIVLEGLPNGVTFLSGNPEPALLYTATIGSPENPPVTLVLWNFTSLEGGPIGSIEIEYMIRVTEEAVTRPSVARRCENPIPGCLILYGEVCETDTNGARYISSIGGQQSVVLEGEPIIEEEQGDAMNDLISIYTGQRAPLESYVPYSDMARAIVSVYPQWFKFTLKLADRVPEKPKSFTSFTIGVDKDGVAANNCPNVPFDGIDTIYSVLYSFEEGCWKIEKSIYKGFWTGADTAVGFQISEERDTVVFWIPRAELSLSQALRWKAVTEVDFVGDKTPNEETYLTSVSIYRLVVKTLPSTTVKIGGVEYTADPVGEVRKYVKMGDISIEVEPQVSVFQDTRMIFSRWSDGSQSNPRLISINQDTALTAEFETEYLVNVASEYGGIAQSTWLREGSTFSISTPTILNISTGSRVVFNGWFGDLVVSDPSFSLIVEWPVSLVATWRLQHLLSLSFQDKAGRSIYPSRFKLSGPSGVLNLTSYEVWVDEGEWRIEEVWYRGVDVHPIPDSSYYVSGPLEIDVSTEVYDVKLVLKDAMGNPISNAVVNWEITFRDGTTQTMGAESSENGTLIIPSIPKGEHEIRLSYKGQQVKVSIDASAGTIEEVSIPLSEAYFPTPIPFILIGVTAVVSLVSLTYLMLYRMCFITSASLKKAEKEAEEKAKELAEAEKRLAEANRRVEEAKTRLENASKKLMEANRILEKVRKQEEPKSWVEVIEEGKRLRITDIDLRLRNKAAQEAWERYKSGEISAEECMGEWEKLGEPDVLEKLREREKKLREEETQQAEKSVEEARVDERRAMDELKQAEQQMEKAREDLEKLSREAKEAEKKARLFREKLDRCRRKPPPLPPPAPPPPPPPLPEAPRKLEKLAPLPSEKLPPPPFVEFPEPQHLSQDQIMLGMAEEFGIIAQRKWSEMERFECSILCTRAIKYILQKPLREVVRTLGFKVMIAPISIAVKSETILGKVMKEAIVHLLGLVEKRFDISAYLPDALLSKLFDIIFPGLSAELASSLAEAAGGVERIEEKASTRVLEDYFKRQNPKVIQVKQAVRFSARETGFYECLCKVDGFILYYPYIRYVVGVFKCLCGRGLPRLITINYKTNKYGYSEGPVEIDERELPPDTPVEAK